jgi:hypothetical protein
MRDRATRWHGTQRTKEHERDVYLVIRGAGWDGASMSEGDLTLTKIDPRPRVVSKPLDTLAEGGGDSFVAARVNRYLVTEISRNYTDQQLRPDFWLVVDAGVVPNPDDVKQTEPALYVRYRLLGGVPEMMEKGWSVSLVEDRQ